MNCAASRAFAKRQVMTPQIREAFVTVFGRSTEALGMEWVYDVAHNLTKVERYSEGGFKFQVQRVNDGAVARRLPGVWQS
jgi:tRNA-splicing ligase RtcB